MLLAQYGQVLCLHVSLCLGPARPETGCPPEMGPLQGFQRTSLLCVFRLSFGIHHGLPSVYPCHRRLEESSHERFCCCWSLDGFHLGSSTRQACETSQEPNS